MCLGAGRGGFGGRGGEGGLGWARVGGAVGLGAGRGGFREGRRGFDRAVGPVAGRVCWLVAAHARASCMFIMMFRANLVEVRAAYWVHIDSVMYRGAI